MHNMYMYMYIRIEGEGSELFTICSIIRLVALLTLSGFAGSWRYLVCQGGEDVVLPETPTATGTHPFLDIHGHDL